MLTPRYFGDAGFFSGARGARAPRAPSPARYTRDERRWGTGRAPPLALAAERAETLRSAIPSRYLMM